MNNNEITDQIYQDNSNFTYFVLGHTCLNLGSRKYSPHNYYPYSPVGRTMNINDHKFSNLNYFSGIFSRPTCNICCFYKTELFTYSFSYLILCDDDPDKGSLQKRQRNVLRRNEKYSWINATNSQSGNIKHHAKTINS